MKTMLSDAELYFVNIQHLLLPEHAHPSLEDGLSGLVTDGNLCE